MKQRIIKIHGCPTCREVLLFIDVDENSSYYVQLVAWHFKDEEYYRQEDTVEFSGDSLLMAERYVCDFSECSANEYANSMEFYEQGN